MEFHYTNERNVQMILALLKENGIKKVIASPGATNESIVGSMQNDPYFEMYSCVDERSAAYMACGLAAESGEVVVLSCTGATSSRDYMPGLTEAYYRHLPILAITSSMPTNRIGHLYPQCTNRSTPPADCVKKSYCIESIKDEDDAWDRMIQINSAISELHRNGGGPVHLNLITRGCSDYSVKELPKINKIDRITLTSAFPKLNAKRVLVFIGEHPRMTKEQTNAIDAFCESFDTVALCDHTSSYKGKYRTLSAIVATQEASTYNHLFDCDILIHIGEISGDYYTMGALHPKEVWRVDEDGEFRDKFRKLTKVFEMPIETFFNHYSQTRVGSNTALKEAFIDARKQLLAEMPELPLSNIWVASQLASKIPNDSEIHFGILNSLRAWNFFEVDNSIETYCNVGGFGIDGIVSSMIGASLFNRDKLYFAVLGDLAFFYDLNAIGNRDIGNNIRILLINNGRGVEFHTYKHDASKFGEDTDRFIAAYGHNGKQSLTLVRDMANALGFEYLSANSKESFAKATAEFISPKINKPIIFEVFTERDNDADVLRLIRQINGKTQRTIIQKAYETVYNIAGAEAAEKIKKIIKR